MRPILLVYGVVLSLLIGQAEAGPLHKERGHVVVALPDDIVLPVDTFHPSSCTPRGVLVVFAGRRRNSATYRDMSIPLARSVCALVFAPHFSRSRFPPDDYQRGGRGLTVIKPLLSWIQTQTGSTLPILLVGHSAGAQYLERVAAYVRPPRMRYIIMNPGTVMEPSMTLAPPYGFYGENENALHYWLATPIIRLVGENDTGHDHHLSQTEPAKDEGINRLDRSRKVWQHGQSIAAHQHIVFGWTFLTVPHTGHNARVMLASPRLEAIVKKNLTVSP